MARYDFIEIPVAPQSFTNSDHMYGTFILCAASRGEVVFRVKPNYGDAVALIHLKQRGFKPQFLVRRAAKHA